jgi:hypothetical protein
VALQVTQWLYRSPSGSTGHPVALQVTQWLYRSPA